MKKSLALILALIMVLCMLPTVAFAKPSQASLTVNVKGEFYNPNTDKHQQFDNLKTTIHVTVNEGEHPSYPVKYYFTKQTYYGSTSSSYYGKEGYKLIVTIGGIEGSDLNAWVFNRDMSNVKGDGRTFYPIWTPAYDTYSNTLWIRGGTPIQPETGKLTINKTVAGLPNDKLPASFTFNVMQGNNVKATVTVNKNGNNGYNAGSATLPHGTYTVVEVSATVDGYTVVTTPSNGEVSISGQPTNITFTNAYTENEPQPETPPAQPDPRPSATPTIDGLTGVQVVEVKCITENSGHAKQAYQLIEGSYAVGEVQGDKESGYTCDITVNPGEYVKAYNEEIGENHTLDPESQTGKITLRWKPDVGQDGTAKWIVDRGVPVVFKVVCAPVVDPSKPEKPSDDAVKTLLGDVVTIDCTNSKVTHEDKTYGLLSGGFSVGDVQGDKEHGYTVNVTVTPDAYVTQYSKDIGEEHNLSPEGQDNLIITLMCAGKGSEWEIVPPTTKTYTVVCGTGVIDMVTVSFNSNGGTAVAPQTIAKGGKATKPANPTRDGYTFDNWYLDGEVYDFSKPVNENITLNAQWKKNDDNPGQDPNPDPSPKPSPKPNPGGHDHGGSTVVVPITVYMPPKTGDMPFWYSIAQFLGLVK